MKKILSKISFAFVCIGLLTTAHADEKVYKLSMAATWGETASPLIDAAKNMANMAEKMSNGRLKIDVDSANKHKAPLGILDMVKGGSYCFILLER